jgi:hypothetical protein
MHQKIWESYVRLIFYYLTKSLGYDKREIDDWTFLIIL